MSELDSFFGWGKEGIYICDQCGETVSLYESKIFLPFINKNSKYPIIAEVDDIELSEIQKKKLKEIKKSNKKITYKLYISFAIFIVLSYGILISQSIDEDHKGYFFIAIFLLLVPLFFWIRKDKV
jgi:hypothetical protein